MHHQTAKAGYRVLQRAAELVDERGYSKEPSENGKVTVIQALTMSARGRSETAYGAAVEAFEEVIPDSLEAWQPRDKRQLVSKLNAAAQHIATQTGIDLAKV